MVDVQTKNLQNLYDKEYVEKFETEQSPLRIRRLMRYVDLPKNSDIADFGCGNGMLLTCLHDKVRTYSGVDFSEIFIDAARKRQNRLGIFNAEFFCESIESFCARNQATFDAGFVMDLAEHVYDRELLKILSSIHNSLKTGSRLYLHTPNADFF